MTSKVPQIKDLLKLSVQNIITLSKEQQVAILERLIHYHNIKYFVDNNPIISDEKFDELTKILEKYQPENSVLYEIVGKTGDVTHPVPMLSIEKKYTYENIKKWLQETGDRYYLIEPKYDGMAARYQNGLLATRGDGYKGEDISHRLSHLNIIGTLPKNNISVYGEVIIPISYFNKKLKETYKNPRNAVVGIIKAKKTPTALIPSLHEGGVHFVIYDQVNLKKVKTKDLLDEETWESLLEEMFQLDYPLDGVVIKVVNKSLRKKVGITSHHEKWQIAYKSPAERKWSKVIEIKDQIGRTGRVTSVAVIEPINLSGATIQNITLHNADFVEKSKIGIGSTVEVCRSGEVIPFITKVIPAKSPHILHTHCPVCKTKLRKLEKYLECPNIKCPARFSQQTEYFFKTLGVEELGLKTINRFINIFNLKSVIDFYKLKENQIAQLERFGLKSGQNIVTNVRETLNKTISPIQLLQALGIKEIGPATSKWIINKYGFENLPKLTVADLKDIAGVGPIKAAHFVNEVKKKWWVVQELIKLGLKFKKEKTTQKLKGLKFCITGTQSQYSRNELIKIINENGGEYKTSVTTDLNYLITGKLPGSKLQKAKKLKIKIIDEQEFLEMQQ